MFDFIFNLINGQGNPRDFKSPLPNDLDLRFTPQRNPEKTPTPTPMIPTVTPPPDKAAEPFVELINNATRDFKLPDNLLYNLLRQESRFNPQALSHAGAQGIAQIVPKWHPNVKDPLNPSEAIPYAASLLRNHYDDFGRWDLALAAYNAGPGAVRQHGGVPPYNETLNYIKNILGE